MLCKVHVYLYKKDIYDKFSKKAVNDSTKQTLTCHGKKTMGSQINEKQVEKYLDTLKLVKKQQVACGGEKIH